MCRQHRCIVDTSMSSTRQPMWMPRYIVSEVDRHPDLAGKRQETPGHPLAQTLLNMLPNWEESEYY